MYCTNCGNELKNDRNFCSNCGSKIENNNVNNQNNVTIKNEKSEDDKYANILCIISIILTFGASFVLGILSYNARNLESAFDYIGGLCPLIGLVLMIVARVKYPNNKFAKILMWIYIVLIILGIVAFILLTIACYIMCGNLSTSNCG